MRIARPPNGFRIALAPGVQTLIAARSETHPRFAAAWADLEARLAFTGHKDGVDYANVGPGGRIAKFTLPPGCGAASIRVGYTVLGDRLTILIAG